MKTTSLIVLLFGVLLGAVNAEIITVQVTSTVSVFDDNGPNGGYFGGGIVIGDTLVMTYSYDTETLDSDSRSNYGVYNQSVPNVLSIIVGGYTLQSNINNLNYGITLFRDAIVNTYLVRSTNNVVSTDAYSDNFNIQWQIDYNPNTFNNVFLPTTAPNISPTNFIQIGDGRDFLIQAVPTFVEIIPEPLTLLTLGLGGMIVFRGRKNR